MAESKLPGGKLSGICPQCDKTLRYSDRFFGRQIRCPACRTPVVLTPDGVRPVATSVIAPAATAGSGSGSETAQAISPVLLLFGYGVVAMLVWLIAALTLGELMATLAVGTVTGCLALITYGPRAMDRLVRRRSESQMDSSVPPIASRTAPSTSSDSMRKISDNEIAAMMEVPHNSQGSFGGLSPIETANEPFEPVEIRSASTPQAAVSEVFKSRPHSLFGSRQKTTAKDIQFCGLGTSVEIDGTLIEDALFYVVDGDFRGLADASLIQLDLPRAKNAAGASGLPYWPEYAEASPNQRRRYINWLATGKKDPNIELGYPFLYFYGLERRAFVDEQDHGIIVDEILRLLEVYGHSRSFQNYAVDFLWANLLRYSQKHSFSDETITRIELLRRTHGDAALSALLAVEYQRSRPLSAKLALLVAECDDRSPRSVVIKRHDEKFRSLFNHKYHNKFGEGLILKASKRSKKWRYHPASPTLLQEHYHYDSRLEVEIPNVLGLPSQFKPLVAIWTECIAELKDFSREHRKSGGEAMTAAMYESLPAELREDDHPDSEAWLALLDTHRDERGHAIVPVSALARLRGIAPRNKLLKSQGDGICATAKCMNFAIEPDPVLSGQRLAWDHHIAIYPVEDAEHTTSADEISDYRSAALLLNLGVTVASSDGVVDPEEMELITEHLEERFSLSPSSVSRLEHLGYLLEKHPSQAATVPKAIKEQPCAARLLVGEYLVAVAAADGIVTTDELKSLKKLYKKLGLEVGSLQDMAGVTVGDDVDATDGLTETFTLDSARIHEILAETAKVRDMLTDAMAVDDGDDSEIERSIGVESVEEATEEAEDVRADAPAAVALEKTRSIDAQFSNGWAGLPVRYHAFADALVRRPKWSHDDLKSLAKEHKLMPSGAIETLNDWSLDSLGDWLVDDTGDTVSVSQSLL